MNDHASENVPFFMKTDTETALVSSREIHAAECHDKSCAEHGVLQGTAPLKQLQGRADIKFPCEFMIKAIGLQSDDLAEHTHSLIVKHAPELKVEHLQVRASSKGKYLSVSATINAVSREQLDSIYRELSSDPRILYTL